MSTLRVIRPVSLAAIWTSFLLFLSLTASAAHEPKMWGATYDAFRDRLIVKGRNFPAEATITLRDADSHATVTTVETNRRGRWVLRLEELTACPLVLEAVAGEVLATADVRHVRRPEVLQAAWRIRGDKLIVSGRYFEPDTEVAIADGDTFDPLATTTTNRRGGWRLVEALPHAPCNINVVGTGFDLILAVDGAATVCQEAPPVDPPTDPPVVPVKGDCQILAFNDLGMHCYDKDFSVFSILPPFNVIHAQVVCQDGNKAPQLLDNASVYIRYKAVADPQGSINTTSTAKTNFWTYITGLFRTERNEDAGLLGADMPGLENTPQKFADYDADHKWFSATGIPITNVDDSDQVNEYPLMRIEAVSRATEAVVASLDIVLPASDEMHCGDCHDTGGVAASSATATHYGIGAWSDQATFEKRYRENILILHDADHGTSLHANQPVLCASCHASPVSGLVGVGNPNPDPNPNPNPNPNPDPNPNPNPDPPPAPVPPPSHSRTQTDCVSCHGYIPTYFAPAARQTASLQTATIPSLSQAMHQRHGKTIDNQLPDATHPAIIVENGTTSCYQCHPGSETQCLRGAMGTAGISCQNCHGDMLAVGGQFQLTGGSTRAPWADEPTCQACHTGDAVNHQGATLRLLTTFVDTDPAATPRVATNKRFAEQDNTLYRDSHGHGNLACEACHGSPHAIWPVGPADANDNIAATQLQGHAGTLSDCTVCHGTSLPLTTNGPHGMHNVNDSRWNRNHEDFFERNPNSCRACHGVNLEGTALSRTAADRTLQTDDHGSIRVPKGTPVSCSLCHHTPGGGGDDDDDD